MEIRSLRNVEKSKEIWLEIENNVLKCTIEVCAHG